MRTTLAESLHYIIYKLLEVPGLRDGLVERQLTEFLPLLLLFIAKNLEQERRKPSDVAFVHQVLHHEHASVSSNNDRAKTGFAR